MSVIRVDNFGPSAGGTTYSARGIAKAWVNFNGTGTIAARDSENVSSLTDNGTGEYDVNFSNAFSSANYAFIISSGALNNSIGGGSSVAGSGRIETRDGSNTLADSSYVYSSAYGDLA